MNGKLFDFSQLSADNGTLILTCITPEGNLRATAVRSVSLASISCIIDSRFRQFGLSGEGRGVSEGYVLTNMNYQHEDGFHDKFYAALESAVNEDYLPLPLRNLVTSALTARHEQLHPDRETTASAQGDGHP